MKRRGLFITALYVLISQNKNSFGLDKFYAQVAAEVGVTAFGKDFIASQGRSFHTSWGGAAVVVGYRVKDVFSLGLSIGFIKTSVDGSSYQGISLGESIANENTILSEFGIQEIFDRIVFQSMDGRNKLLQAGYSVPEGSYHKIELPTFSDPPETLNDRLGRQVKHSITSFGEGVGIYKGEQKIPEGEPYIL